MPMIKQFPGPRTALAWHFLHAYRWIFPIGTLFAMVLGHADTTRVHGDEFGSFFTFLCIPLIGAALYEHGHSPFQLRLPERTNIFVFCEMLVTAILLVWFWFCHAAAAAYAAGGVMPDVLPLFKHVAFGLLALVFARQRGTVNNLLLIIWLMILLVGFTYFVFVMAGAIGAWASVPQLPWFDSDFPVVQWIGAAVALGLAAVANFRVLVRTTDRMRHGVDAEQEDYVEIFHSDIDIVHEAPEVEQASALLSDESMPFASRVAAHNWYALHLFLRTALWRGAFWACTLGALSWVPFIFSIAGDSDTTFADFISAVALALLTARFGWWWVEPGEHLPVSEWSQSRVFLRMAFGGLLTATVFIWTCRALDLWWEPSSDLPDALSPGLLLAGLWTGWCGLALGPGLLLGLGLVFVVGSYAGFAHIDTVVTPICLAWLLLLQCYQQKLSGRKLLPGLALLLVSMAGVLAGQVVLDRGLLPESLAWCLRETLGAGLIVALLHQHAALGILANSALWRLRTALLVLAGGSSLAAMIWGPFHGPEHGVLATYLTLGVIPPLFLPWVTVPTYMAWMRTRGIKHKEMRRKMRWTT